MTKPSGGEFGIASDVLLWMHEQSDNGADRDAISYVRHLIDEAEDE